MFPPVCDTTKHGRMTQHLGQYDENYFAPPDVYLFYVTFFAGLGTVYDTLFDVEVHHIFSLE